jgi:hypothetical protein
MVLRTRKDRLRKLAGLVLAALTFYLALRWFEYHQVFQPYATLGAEGASLGRAWEDVYFSTADGVRLNGWFFPASADSPRKQLVVLFCHGNGGNLSHRLDVFAALLETGVAVFGFDYRGYARSQGRPSETGTYLDAQAAHAWLCQRGFAPTNILAYGESLGGGIVSELALREPLAGVILQSTFTSIPNLGADLFPFLPVRTLARIQYDTLSRLPRLKVPVLVMHGRADTVVPFRHGERLFAAASAPKLFWELAGDHNDILDSGRTRFVTGIERFLRLVEKASSAND